VTDRPTDHAARSVTTGRIYVRSTAMQPKNEVTAVTEHNTDRLPTYLQRVQLVEMVVQQTASIANRLKESSVQTVLLNSCDTNNRRDIGLYTPEFIANNTITLI